MAKWLKMNEIIRSFKFWFSCYVLILESMHSLTQTLIQTFLHILTLQLPFLTQYLQMGPAPTLLRSLHWLQVNNVLQRLCDCVAISFIKRRFKLDFEGWMRVFTLVPSRGDRDRNGGQSLSSPDLPEHWSLIVKKAPSNALSYKVRRHSYIVLPHLICEIVSRPATAIRLHLIRLPFLIPQLCPF